LENDADGCELKKKAKANATDSDSDSDEEATSKRSTVAKSSPGTKSSIRVDEQKLEAQPSTTGVVVELADKEKRATNKKIRTEVLQNIHLFKADLSVYNAFGKEHWKVLLSQMENDGDYTHQLFFGQSRVSQSWRYETLVKTRVKLEIGIIRPNVNVGGQALGETTAMAARSAIEVAKRVTFTHTIRISDDVAANDVAVGQVVSTLEAFRGVSHPSFHPH
jgi:hypothetical protein